MDSAFRTISISNRPRRYVSVMLCKSTNSPMQREDIIAGFGFTEKDRDVYASVKNKFDGHLKPQVVVSTLCAASEVTFGIYD